MEIRLILSALSRHKTAAALIGLEIALTCAIICNALFLIGDNFAQMNEVSGVVEEELVNVRMTSIGQDPQAQARTLSDLAALRAIPGVVSAAVVNQIPYGFGSWNNSLSLTANQPRPTLNATVYYADEHFIDTLGVQLIAGRNFEPGEYGDISNFIKNEFSPSVVLVTRKLAERLFQGQSALGKEIRTGDEVPPLRIVGILDHLVRPNSQGGQAEREYTYVLPVRAAYVSGSVYLLRTQPARRAEVLQAAFTTLRAQSRDRVVIEDRANTLQDLRRGYFQQQSSMVWLLGGVILALLIVTALGIVGLASFWVQQRTRQIGVRRALGATRGQILRYFQMENFLITTVGIAFGMLLAFAINQFLMTRFELPRLPWYYFPVGAAVLWALGQLAVLWPAQRAAAVPPAVATRSV
jgi:putative ABC transport system permease protein